MEKEALATRLTEKGYKLTKQRQAILQVFEESNKHLLTAQEVFELAISSHPKGMNFSTVYRNLEILTQINILNKVVIGPGLSGFELTNLNQHHHHLICKSCGRTSTINFCPFEALNPEVMEGFEPTDHKFEVYGYCKSCK